MKNHNPFIAQNTMRDEKTSCSRRDFLFSGGKLLLAASLADLLFFTSDTNGAQSIPFELIDLNMGESLISFRLYQNKEGLSYINLHDNENICVEAAKNIISQYGGRFLEIYNNKPLNERKKIFLVKEKHNGSLVTTKYDFDPNRTFTDNVFNSAKFYLHFSEEARNAVRKFRKNLTELLVVNQNQPIVSVHNNDYGFSINSYLKGGKEYQNAAKIPDNPHIEPALNEGNFFLVTNETYYHYLKDKKYNVVLQNDVNPTDDGSLSIYCWQNNINFICVEARHNVRNDLQNQIQMLVEVNKMFSKLPL